MEKLTLKRKRPMEDYLIAERKATEDRANGTIKRGLLALSGMWAGLDSFWMDTPSNIKRLREGIKDTERVLANISEAMDSLEKAKEGVKDVKNMQG